MRLIKMFGLAAIAVGAFMAFVGATSASAVTSLEETVICKVKEDPCKAANVLGEGTKIKANQVSGTVPTLLAGTSGSVLCTSSSTSGKTAAGQNLAHGLIEALSFGGCTRDIPGGGTENCTVTNTVSATKPLLALALLITGHLEYHLVVTKHVNGDEPGATVKCGFFIECTFHAAEVLFEILLDEVNHDTVLDVLQTLLKTGGFCPNESIWHAKYLLECEVGGVFTKSCWTKMHEKSVL